MRQALERAREVGNRRGEALCVNALASVQFLLGQWPESRLNFEASLAQSREIGSAFGQVIAGQRLSLLKTNLGLIDEGYHDLLAVLAMARASDSPMVQYHSGTRILGTLVQNRLLAGDLAGALDYVAQGFAEQERTTYCPTCDVLLYPAAVETYLAAGDRAQALAACQKAEETAASFRSRSVTAVARYLRGLLSEQQDDRSLATRCYQEAAAVFDSVGQRYDYALCLEALARTSTGDAGRLRDQAVAIYRELGALPALQRASSLPALAP